VWLQRILRKGGRKLISITMMPLGGFFTLACTSLDPIEIHLICIFVLINTANKSIPPT